jgi:integrase
MLVALGDKPARRTRTAIAPASAQVKASAPTAPEAVCAPPGPHSVRADHVVSNAKSAPVDSALRAASADDETFPTITPHDLRHSAASLAISAGANVKAVQRMLGHAKASMTLDVYADLFDDDLDVVADRLDTAIKTSTTRKTSNLITAD